MSAQRLRLISVLQLPDMAERVAAISPDIELIQVQGDAPLPADLRGDILLTLAFPTPHLPALLNPARGVRWVHVFGTGVDSFPLELVGDRVLTCSRGASGTPIAEWVMAMLLADAKQLPRVWVQAPPANWHFANLASLAGQRLGLVGLGAIGTAVARRARAFDMQVSALVRRPRALPEGVAAAGSIEALLAESDYLVLAAPATPATHHLLNRRTLAAARPGLRLINVARGSLVDHDALRQALDSGTVATAYLDAVEPEPPPAGHWLYSHPQVRLSPHVSWSEPGAMAVLEQLFYANLERYWRGEPLAGLVDQQAGY
ncbi:MAG: NAD(P)-dependent oxidoreductase [Spongiibacteraceae bacterium]|jgi:phosphoglycerate dehydrogenase-like enzyme|nr:NAD(P)-dependent oxidoreductase [Spongiibacteraceae bacterium]